MRNIRIVVIGLTALLGAMSPRVASAQDSWSYEVAPFLWAAGIEGREGVRGTSVAVDASFKDLVEFVNIGAALRMTARRPPVGWYAEASYVELKDDVPGTSGTVRFRTTQTFAEGGLLYELSSAFAIYGGLRYQGVDTTLEFPNLRGDDSQGWIDGVVGARWTPLVSDTWFAWVRADVGAGSSDLVWLAEAGGGYRWGTSWAAYLAYRVLDTDYDHAGFLYDIQQSGLLLGFGYRF